MSLALKFDFLLVCVHICWLLLYRRH